MKKIIRAFISWFGYFGLKFLIFWVRFLPEKVIYSLGELLSDLYYIGSGKNRKLALRNLELALGSQLSKAGLKVIIRESCRIMGRAILDTICYKNLSDEQIREFIAIEGLENLEKASKKGKGIIIVSAHMGSFTLIGYRLMLEGYKASYVARHMRDKKLEHILMNLSRNTGQKIIFSEPIVTFYRRGMRVLSRNEALILEVDQNFGREGVPVNFFGRQAMVASGPLVLAMRTKAVILPIFITSETVNRHVIKIEPPVELNFSGNHETDIRNNLQKIINVIEGYIRRYPGQWFNWVHKRWEVK